MVLSRSFGKRKIGDRKRGNVIRKDFVLNLEEIVS